jgi:hypothetical protein
MYKHHEETIRRITDKLKVREDVLGIMIGGSIAHGFATEISDVDIMIVVSDEDYRNRRNTGEIHYWENECCTYPEGYIDGKYTSVEFMNKVSEQGSEPARFAFDGAILSYTQIEGLDALISRITHYPLEKKQENIRKFFAQLEAWKWYCYEAIKHKNEYLLNHSISNLVLFGGRLILAHNETLYPYHKWFLKVLSQVECKPDHFMEKISEVLSKKDTESVEAFHNSIMTFTDWQLAQFDWPAQFMLDSELNWMDGWTPVADI